MCVMKITNMSKRQSRHQMYDDVTSFFWPVDIAQHLFWYVQSTMHVQNVLKKLQKKNLMQHKKIACSEEYMLQNSQFSIQPNLSWDSNAMCCRAKNTNQFILKKECFAILSNEAGSLILHNFIYIKSAHIPISNAIYIMKIVN